MLIAGAGGVALQLFEDLLLIKNEEYVFWSESGCKYRCIADNFKILQSDKEVKNYFSKTSDLFAVGIWNIKDRSRLIQKFESLNGKLGSFVSPLSEISSFASVGNGTIILNQAAAEPEVSIGEKCIINKRANFGHGAIVKNYCSIGPYTIIGSDAEIGEGSYIGMGAIVQPNIKVGSNVIIAAGSVITRNIPDHAVMSGVPAKIRFYNRP